VNFVFPYEALKAANVAGTDEILKLAAAGAARLHYVSTIGVFAGGAGSLATVFEDAPPSDPDRLALGYMRAKWVAEQRVTQAIQRGLDATIHRPGTIAGHAVTGAFNPDDFLVCMLKGCVELGLAPAVDATINMVPVDYVSRAIVDVALSTPGTAGPFHMVSPTAASWLDLVRWVRELGYPISEVPYKEWRSVLMSRAEATGNSLVPLMPLFAAHDNTDWLRLPPYDDTRTKRALAGGGCPPIDAALIRRYVERFVVDGFMPRPR